MQSVSINKNSILIILLLLLFQSKMFGQDFQWVYNIIGKSTQLNGYPQSQINDVIVDKLDNIYITGSSRGKNDFKNNPGNIIIDSENVRLSFIIKLNKNKTVLWVKHFTISEKVDVFISKLHLDQNQNLLLTGSANHSGAPFIDLNPDPGTQQTITNPSAPRYGVIIKLNPHGNYLDSWYLEDYNITDLAFDSSQNITAIGNRLTNSYYTATVFKLDNNLNSIWTKHFDGFSTEIYSLVIDNFNGLIITGNYRSFLNFAGENLLKPNGIFICKISPTGNEEWILDQGSNEIPPNTLQNIIVDSNNILHASAQYSENNLFNFKNTSITAIADLPYQGNRDAVLFSFDTNGNYLSHFTLTGVSERNINSFAISEYDEFVIGLRTSGRLIFTNSDGDTTSFNTDRENILLKVSPSHQVIEYKEIDIRMSHVQFDSDQNIIMGDSFRKETDFDPHPINEYIVENDLSSSSAYVLKLGYCDTYPPTGDNTKTFCSDANATIADLEINEYGVNWYASNNSTVPLDSTTLLLNGQTYYAAKDKIENCPEIVGRHAVLVTINPVPPAPTLNPNQPCFYNGLRLADLIIEGTNFYFYDNATSITRLNPSTTINPETTYYVSQMFSGCESPRTVINISGQSAASLNDYSIDLCDNDKNNFETVNLSNYIQYILNGIPSDYTISYHGSQDDAINNTAPILNYLDYQAGNQVIYIRFVSNEYLCFEIATLTINISSPPEITEVIVRDGTDNNSITILPNNTNHLYSIDGIYYQSSNLFESLNSGEYTIYVKDKSEICGEVTKKAYILTYPKFFTPNGDGFNDFWKIRYAQFQFSVDVEIYDRYGKLITSFDKNSPGWDGTYNGEKLPATDYWFKVTRILDKEVIHKGHFSLKR